MGAEHPIKCVVSKGKFGAMAEMGQGCDKRATTGRKIERLGIRGTGRGGPVEGRPALVKAEGETEGTAVDRERAGYSAIDTRVVPYLRLTLAF